MFTKIARKFKRLVDRNKPTEYKYNDFSVILPAGHMLPKYQRDHSRYDRFLPHLASYIQGEATIIDIGANVGDTLAGMASMNSKPTFICIEPDAEFFELLKQNISRIEQSKPGLKVHAVKALIGKTVSGASLEGKGGTKHAVLDKSGTLASKALDQVLAPYGNIPQIRVLKSDVDGFDYDVIDSSLATIRQHKPIVFFECQQDDLSQKIGYQNTFDALQAEGYTDWTLFDNFGQVMIRTPDLKIVEQLIDYVWSQNLRKTTRTIYYYDVLATQSSDVDFVSKVLNDYI